MSIRQLLLFFCVTLLSNNLFARPAVTEKIENFIKGVGTPEVLGQVTDLSYEEISTADPYRNHLICADLNLVLPKFKEQLKALPLRSYRTYLYVTKYSLLLATTCQWEPIQLAAYWRALADGPRLQELFPLMTHKSVAAILPARASGAVWTKDQLKEVQLSALFNWSKAPLALALGDEKCQNQGEVKSLPAEDRCFASWVWQKLNDEKIKSRSVDADFSQTVVSYLISENIVNTPTLFMELIRADLAQVHRLLTWWSTKSEAEFWQWARATLPTLLPAIAQFKDYDSKQCDRYERHLSYFLKQQEIAAHPQALFLYAPYFRLHNLACAHHPHYRDLVERHLKTIAQLPKTVGQLSSEAPLKLEEIAFMDFDKDLERRSLLGLGFSRGARLDNEEVVNQADIQSFVIDQLIGSYLRNIDGSPWVYFEESIEDASERELRNRTVMARIAQENLSFARFLQLSYLFAFDTQYDLNQVESIRQLAFKVEQVLPSFHPIRLQIHNGLTRSNIEAMKNYAATLTAAERSSIQAYYEPLLSALVKFFELDEGIFSKLKSADEKLFSQIESDLEKSTTAAKVAVAIQLDQRLDQLEQQKETNSANYLLLLQMMAYNHQLLIRSLSLAPELDPAFKDYWQVIFGLSISEPDLLRERITAEVGKLYERKILFKVYLYLQAKQQLNNREFYKMLYLRDYFLARLNDKVIRDWGVNYLDYYLHPLRSDKIEDLRVMNEGVAYGKVVWVDQAQIGKYVYKGNEILVTDSLPTELGVTAGLVTSIYQPLASHVDLRTKERGTPNLYLKSAHAVFSPYVGQWIELVVDRNYGYKIRVITPAEVPARPRIQTQLPAYQRLSSEVVIDLDGSASAPQALTTTPFVGAKASGVAVLRQLFGKGPSSLTPKSYALNFNAYFDFIRTFGIEEAIASFLRRAATLPPEAVAKELKKIRNLFQEAAASEKFQKSELVQSLQTKFLVRLKEETIAEGHTQGWDLATACFRFRSSTNAEDLVEFTGAGLYKSATGCLAPADEKKSVAAALGKVWGSLWTDRAFAEREYYGIDHQSVAMAVLMHRSWPSEDQQGVALSRSLVSPQLYLSVANGEESITNSAGGEGGDEILVTRLASGEMVVNKNSKQFISNDQILELSRVLEKIYTFYGERYYDLPQFPTMRMDVEFKFQDGKLFVKQARPFFGTLD